MEDDSRALWLYTSCGLVRIARPEVERWAAGVDGGSHDAEKKSTVEVAVFDSVDGVRTHPTPSGFHPLAARSRDGRLWFLPFDGVSVVDPRHLPFNRLPPPVHIEKMIADRRAFDASSASSRPLRLPPAIRDLEIDYTA